MTTKMSKTKSTSKSRIGERPSEHLKSTARSLGFTLTGVCPAVAPTGVSRLAEWLDRGYAGEMHYLAARQEAYTHPRYILDGVRSILMLGLPYSRAGEAPAEPNLKSKIQNQKSPAGRISRYALDADYHDIVHDKLKALIAALQQITPGAKARGVVDTAPLLEREFAQLAGLGWIGKNTLLINKPAGSYFFLAALLTDLVLDYDEPFIADHCGTCRACLEACPTNAFPQPYVLDATRCISYLTIELKGPIPLDLRSQMSDWLFGCDVCQDVCPWNNRSGIGNRESGVAKHESRLPAPDSRLPLTELFSLDDDSFRRRFRHTPLWRPRRRGILRNAAIVLGNTLARSANEENAAAIAALIRGLNDTEPLVRGASAWALGQIGGAKSRHALQQRQSIETDAMVRQEIDDALRLVVVPSVQSTEY